MDWTPPAVRPVTATSLDPCPGPSVMLGQDSASVSPVLEGDGAMNAWRGTSTYSKIILSSVCLVTVIRRGQSMALCYVTNQQDNVLAN